MLRRLGLTTEGWIKEVSEMSELKYWHNGMEYVENPVEEVPNIMKYLIDNNMIWVDYQPGFSEYAVTYKGIPGVTIELLYDDVFMDSLEVDREKTLEIINTITEKLRKSISENFPDCEVFREDDIDDRFFDCWIKLFIPYSYGEEKSIELGKLFAKIVNEEESKIRFKITDSDIVLADIQNVEGALEQKIEWFKEHEPYALREIDDLETALRMVGDLIYDLD